jgi:hypothetical protein
MQASSSCSEPQSTGLRSRPTRNRCRHCASCPESIRLNVNAHRLDLRRIPDLTSASGDSRSRQDRLDVDHVERLGADLDHLHQDAVSDPHDISTESLGGKARSSSSSGGDPPQHIRKSGHDTGETDSVVTGEISRGCRVPLTRRLSWSKSKPHLVASVRASGTSRCQRIGSQSCRRGLLHLGTPGCEVSGFLCAEEQGFPP